MAKVREQTCTISHHDRQCWLHLDTLTQSWALRVMNTEHGKGTTTLHLATFPATPLGSNWGVTGTSGHSDWIHIQLAKQLRQAHAKIPHTHEGWEAPEPGKDLARVEAKPRISTLEVPSYCTPKRLMGKKHLLLRQTRARILLRSQSISALFPYQTSPGSFRECTNGSSLLQQNMGNTETQRHKKINRIKIMKM